MSPASPHKHSTKTNNYSVNHTRRNEKTHWSKFFILHLKQLDAHYKTTINHGHDNVASTPLTDEKAMTTGRAERLEQNGKVKTNTNTYRLQNSDSTRATTVKTKIVTRQPQIILNSIEQVTKGPGNSPKLMAIKLEQHMTTFKRRG